MRLEVHGSLAYLVSDSGVLHVSGTLYLNQEHANPHTVNDAARALRTWARFASAFNIDLAERSLEGRWLTEGEKRALQYLVFRPIEEIEAMSDRDVRQIASAAKHQPRKNNSVVEANTAIKRITKIAGFLKWFHGKIIEPRLPIGSPVIGTLRRQVDICTGELKTAIAGSSATHPHRINSVPYARFLDIYSNIYLNYRKIFTTESGKSSGNAARDRAIVLLASEGVRPGAIGNLAIADFKWEGGKNFGYVSLKDNTARREKLSTATPVQKGSRSKKGYNSKIIISIWPMTADAIQYYIKGERTEIASLGLRNRSNGFLFLGDHGGPINDRGTLSRVFRQAGYGLDKLGLLSKDPKDPYLFGESYEFNAYLLRHSSATLFYANHIKYLKSEVVMDSMKMRYGWSFNSVMPEHYAKRAMIDTSSLILEDFIDNLFDQAKATKYLDVGNHEQS